MSSTFSWRGLVALVVVISLTACEDRTEPKEKPRSLADAAAQLRSRAMVDTTWRGHVTWNGSAQILKESDCYLLDHDYVMVGRGDGVVLRLIYRAARSGVPASVDFSHPSMVELQLDHVRYDGSRYRAEPPNPARTDITIENELVWGVVRLATSGAEGVNVAFEFRCN